MKRGLRKRLKSRRNGAFSTAVATPMMSWGRPEFGIQITVPTILGQIDAGASQHDTLLGQTPLLQLELAGSRRKRQAAIRAQDAMPRQFLRFAGLPQNAPDQARATLQACPGGDLSVTGDTTRWNPAQHPDYGLLPLLRTGLHDRHGWGTLAHA